jgi:hypothetical protein
MTGPLQTIPIGILRLCIRQQLSFEIMHIHYDKRYPCQGYPGGDSTFDYSMDMHLVLYSGNNIYDPTYGCWFASEEEYENTMCAGFSITAMSGGKTLPLARKQNATVRELNFITIWIWGAW